jgi:hypothetical protein
MKYSMQQFKQEVSECLDLCKKCVVQIKNGYKLEYTLEQLEGTIIPELQTLLLRIDHSDFPPEQDRFLLSFALAFKEWCWVMNNSSELYVRLLKLDDHYKLV